MKEDTRSKAAQELEIEIGGIVDSVLCEHASDLPSASESEAFKRHVMTVTSRVMRAVCQYWERSMPSYREEESTSAKPSMGFVYIAKQTNADGIYKIGITKSISGRLVSFSTGNAFIEMIASKQSLVHRAIEKDIHRQLEAFRVKGEWFALEKETLDQLVSDYGFNVHVE